MILIIINLFIIILRVTYFESKANIRNIDKILLS